MCEVLCIGHVNRLKEWHCRKGELRTAAGVCQIMIVAVSHRQTLHREEGTEGTDRARNPIAPPETS